MFSGYGAGLAKVAGPTGGYLVGYLLLAFIGGLFIEKSNGQPVVSAVGLVLGDAACYVLGTAWIWPRSWCPALWVPCCASVWCRPVCCI